MVVPDKICELVERFNTNICVYKDAKYNETQTRQEFINPFFKALGWDIDNESGRHESDKDVVHEDSVHIGKGTKAPDYGFYIGRKLQFFVEAKKPSVDVKSNIHPAYQLRRYGWSAKLPVSILTDFEEFAVYDCRVAPKKTDAAANARMLYMTYGDYLKRWSDIANLLSREAVLGGSLNIFMESHKAQKGTTEVDTAFLQEIERWRDMLARNIALRNSQLTHRELNFAVQRTIDRIIFLRICEDRGIEPYGQLQAIYEGQNIYASLLDRFYQADSRYNSGIFHFQVERNHPEPHDVLTPNIQMDDKVLKDILRNLYYPDSPYEFSVLPADILGHVYEQFLGKVIRLTAGHQAKVEEKPEVKKAGGIYYTPTYIVEYIVSQTVGILLNDSTPQKVELLRILDPACGSGSFLLGAYQYLLDWHRYYYITYTPDKWIKGKAPRLYQNEQGEWKLTIDERKRILLNNVYGVDIDSQAVEVTKLSLLLKVLEGEDEQTISRQMALLPQRVLPNLSNNVKCGNSLIGSDFYMETQGTLFNDEEKYRINTFDWNAEFSEVMQQGGFNAIIGNPPYIEIQKLASIYPQETSYLKKIYTDSTLSSGTDIYIPFIQKGADLLQKNGRLGFICPNRFLVSDYGNGIKKYLQKYNIYEIVNFKHYFVFNNANTYTCIICFENAEQHETIVYKELRGIYKTDDRFAKQCLNNDKNEHCLISKISPTFKSDQYWYFMTKEEKNIFDKIYAVSDLFETVYDNNFQGLICGKDKVFILNLLKQGEKTSKFFSKELDHSVELENEIMIQIIGDSDIKNYHIDTTGNNYIIFPYSSTGIILEPNAMADKYPLAYQYLKVFKKELSAREKSKFNDMYWYRFSRNQNLSKQKFVKIMIPHVVKKMRAAFDIHGKFAIKNVGVNGITLKEEVKESILYFLALLNCPISTFIISKISINLSGGFYACNKQFSSQLPIRRINFDNASEKKIHDTIVDHVEQMISLNKQAATNRHPQTRTMLERQITFINHRINELIYSLYDLTKESGEVQIIETTE